MDIIKAYYISWTGWTKICCWLFSQSARRHGDKPTSMMFKTRQTILHMDKTNLWNSWQQNDVDAKTFHRLKEYVDGLTDWDIHLRLNFLKAKLKRFLAHQKNTVGQKTSCTSSRDVPLPGYLLLTTSRDKWDGWTFVWHIMSPLTYSFMLKVESCA